MKAAVNLLWVLLSVLGAVALAHVVGVLKPAEKVNGLWLVVAVAVSLMIIYRLWLVGPPVGTLWRTAIVGILAYTLAVMWPAAGFLWLVKLGCIGIGIPLAYLALQEFSAEEIAQIRSFLPGRILPVTQHQRL